MIKFTTKSKKKWFYGESFKSRGFTMESLARNMKQQLSLGILGKEYLLSPRIFLLAVNSLQIFIIHLLHYVLNKHNPAGNMFQTELCYLFKMYEQFLTACKMSKYMHSHTHTHNTVFILVFCRYNPCDPRSIIHRDETKAAWV